MSRRKPRTPAAEEAPGALSGPTVATKELPFETHELRKGLADFLAQPFTLPGGSEVRLGAVRFGVYAFFDYDEKPIYVGQTKATLGDRIGRHLTNQRTDVVAMNVLDPFEVHGIKVWPLPQFQHVTKKSPKAVREPAAKHLNALEYQVFASLQHEEFSFLNEKEPKAPPPEDAVEMPTPVAGEIVSPELRRLRDHPDIRIARRAATLAKLAQKISERDVNHGLRKTLVAQATRMLTLTKQRYEAVQDLRRRGIIMGDPTDVLDPEDHGGSRPPEE